MSGYIGTQPVPQATQTRETFTATAGQTTFNTGGYTAGYIDVFLNGVKLVSGTDYTATNGSDVVLLTGASAGDTLETVAYTAFTVADQTFTGNIVMADGLTVDNDGATVLTVDRATSDGMVLDVQKNGTSVGGISTVYDALHLNANADFGVKIASVNSGAFQYVAPVNQATSGSIVYDGQVNLGLSISRFKDLYLSGGVYLGGTGSANYLDDYEVGRFTPSLDASSVTYTARQGDYVKVGKLVTVYIFITWSSVSGWTSNITGLPYTCSNLDTFYPMGSVFNNDGVTYSSGRTTLIPYANDGTTLMTVTCVGSGVNASGPTLSSSGYLHISLTYQTT